MKALFLVLFSLSIALAQVPGGTPLASWAGSTTNANTTWVVPSISGTTCTNGTYNSTYAAFNISFATTKVRQVIALSYSTYFYVSIYNGTFNPQNPCGNFVVTLGDNNNVVQNYGPDVEDSFLFQANINYVFVVGSTSSNTGADFAVAIYDTVASGNIGQGAPVWSPPSVSTSGTCTQSSYSAAFALFSWTQNGTGYFDISFGATYNNTWSSYTAIALFHNALTNAQVQSNTLCSSANFITALSTYSSGYRAIQLYGIPLVSGQQYTVVGSGYGSSSATAFANYGFTVVTSRIAPAIFLPTGYALPTGSGSSCQPSTTYNNQSFAAGTIVAGSNNYVAQVSLAVLSNSYYYSNWTTPDSGDQELIAYNGANLGTSTSAPTSCGANYLGIVPQFPYTLNIAPSQTYSLVAGYYGSSFKGSGQGYMNAYLVYVLTGAPAGNVNTSVPSSTGAGSSTGHGAVATGSHGGSTTNFTWSSTTTSASSAVACSFMFVVLAIMALMF